MVMGAAASAIGVCLGVADFSDVSAALTLAGLLTTVWSLHRLGRAGPA